MNALITGASGGIGYELAKIFAQNGWNLILVARSQEKLNSFSKEISKQHGISAHVIVKDLTDPESASELYREVELKSWTVDALVNNAGIGSFGFFSQTDFAVEASLLELNVVTLTKLTKLFLKPMIQRGEGYVLNVASTAAFQPGPLMAVYYASKAYVLSFSEAIADELEGSGVSVTALCPGATLTGFRDAAGMQRSRLYKLRVMDVKRVAREGYDGMIQRKRVVIPGTLNKVLVSGSRLLPRKLVTKVTRKIQEADK